MCNSTLSGQFLKVWQFLLMLLVLGTSSANATDTANLSADEIYQKAIQAAYYQGEDGKAEVTMTITDDSGRRRNRKFSILRKDTDDSPMGEQRYYVFFHRPADVQRTSFLVWKYPSADDDRWLYLPALDLVRRIAASDERTSFIGSHFFYEDISGRGAEEDSHELVETTDNYYVLKNIPKNPESVEFKEYTMWVHRHTFIATKVEYRDANNTAYRTYTAENVAVIDSFPTVTKATMADSSIGGSTTIEYSQVAYNLDLDKGLFTERFLRTPPALVTRR